MKQILTAWKPWLWIFIDSSISLILNIFSFIIFLLNIIGSNCNPLSEFRWLEYGDCIQEILGLNGIWLIFSFSRLFVFWHVWRVCLLTAVKWHLEATQPICVWLQKIQGYSLVLDVLPFLQLHPSSPAVTAKPLRKGSSVMSGKALALKCLFMDFLPLLCAM